jgi:hypothetical protein
MATGRSDAVRKQDIALRLSLAGASPAEIAASKDPDTGIAPLYGSPAAVGKALRAARERVGAGGEPRTKADDVEQEIARLDRVQRALWPAALQGDVASAREIRLIVQARAALKGVAKGLAAEETPTAADPVDELQRRRESRRAAAQ